MISGINTLQCTITTRVADKVQPTVGRLVVIVTALTIINGCDSVLMVKGRFVDQYSNPYEACTLTAEHGRDVIGKSEILGGHFEETFVFGGIASPTLQVRGSCVGSEDRYQRTIDKLPGGFEPIELGDIVLRSKTLRTP